jgi:hypothetical protein
MSSINQACGRMVARRTRTGAAALHPDRLCQDARRIGGAVAANGKGDSNSKGDRKGDRKGE